jgi:RHS repeat-associated protein
VDVWSLGYQFRDPGDGTAPSLWLASVSDTGKTGGSAATPAITFEGTQLENRVDALEGIPPLYKWRLTDVYDEFGGHLRVNYSGKECTRSALPAPDTNTLRCFPQYWTPDGATAPQLDWFHKYVAVQLLEDDQSGVAGIEETDYEYLGGGAWHHDDNELTPAKYRSWSDWRGYAKVRTTHGSAGGARSQSDALYFRGMDGDTLTSGTRSVSVTDSEGVAVTDNVALAGATREEINYTGVAGTVLDGTIDDQWISAATATNGATKAYQVGVARQRTRTALSTGGWRRTEEQTTFDSYGLPTQVNDLGDTATSADDTCTRTTYARNTTQWLIDLEAREEIVGVACTITASYPADVISDERTFYDGSTTLGAAPTKGDITLTQEVASYSGSTPTYVQATRSTYDAYGRVLDAYDALDRRTSTSYTPAGGGAVTGTTVTNALGHVTTTTIEPAWAEATTVVDPNGRRTDLAYDPLGRLTGVWLPDRSRSGGQTPSQRFSYLVRTNEPNVVATETLRDDGSYDTSYAFLDGRLRQRQTQEPAPDGGRVVTDTYYDSRGLEARDNEAYWNSDAAGTTLLSVADNTVPGHTTKVYDGAERETTEIFLSYSAEKWRTTTAYGGDRVDVTPPAGGTATTTITDVEDRTTEFRQYTSATPTGAYDATTYTYAKNGDIASVTDPAGNVWRYTYDVRGRKTTDADPDKGTTTYTYDNADQLLTSTDARGVTLARGYDGLGRPTGVYDTSTSGTRRAAWTYDTLANGTVVKGQLASTTRYVAGNAYTITVNGYDARYRSLGTTMTIPTAEGALAGSYQVNMGYTTTGLPLTVSYPPVGGLAAETLRYTYDAFGRLQTAQTGLATLLTGASYTPYDEPSQYTLSATSGKQLTQTFFYEDGTRRLLRTRTDTNVGPTALSDVNYTYDPSGNITRIADTPTGGVADTQCFNHDYLGRLSQAWTSTNACATAPSVSTIGGPAPYWQAWTYDKTGNRLTETNYNTTSGAGVTTTSTYPTPGSPRPHALSTVATSGQTNSFSYDQAGNTVGRNVAGSAQTLTWDPEGNLATVTEGSKVTEFLYDADGDRLIRRDADATTLYLDNAELRLSKTTNTVTATRFYTTGSATAVRSTAGLSFEVTDHLGTADLTVNGTDLSVSQRRYLPFGKLRGAAPASWPDDKGFVGGTVDSSTGLTELGAREYDPGTGRFISVDPVIDPDDPQQLNAYAYANNSPITMSDPDGMWRILPGGHYCDACGGYSHAPKPKAKKKRYKPPTGHPTQRFKPGTAKYRQHVKDLKKQSRALKRAAAKHRAAARKKAAAKKKNSCHGFFGCIRHAVKKVAHKAKSVTKHVGRGLAWLGKKAWEYRSGILLACSIFFAVVCGTLAAINSAVDSYRAFKEGNIRGGILNAVSAATGGIGAGYAGASKLAFKAATKISRIHAPLLPTRVGYRISLSMSGGLGRAQAALTRGGISANYKSNLWGVASAFSGLGGAF